jgi:hypothetical protein
VTSDQDVRYALRRLGVDLEPEKWTGAWVALYGDASSVRVFATEIEALRHAIGFQMTVKFVPYGEDIFQYKDPA